MKTLTVLFTVLLLTGCAGHKFVQIPPDDLSHQRMQLQQWELEDPFFRGDYING